MSEHRLSEHPGPAELARAVAEEVAAILFYAIRMRGSALLFVPGGSTPKASFALLTEAPLDWARVTLLPGDERLAPPGSGLSNFEAMQELFAGTGARLQPLVRSWENCELAAREADETLGALPWPPDLVWLGLGEDGHIASIFPGECGAAALDSEGRAECVRPDPLPAAAPVQRVTLTLPAILSARAIILAGTGQAKKALLEQRVTDADAAALPVHQLLARAERPVLVHWSPS